MKKILLSGILLALVLMLTACGGNGDSGSGSGSAASAADDGKTYDFQLAWISRTTDAFRLSEE